MAEHHLEWVIVGAFTTYGSCTKKEEAEFYAESLRTLRNLECSVQHRDQVKENLLVK